MLTNANKYDILNPSVRSTDFLCQHSPLVCAVELNRSSDRRRTGAFLLEIEMRNELGQFIKGNEGYWKNKKRSQSTVEKMRKANLGKKISKETKKKMSIIHKSLSNSGRFKKGEHLGINHPNWKGKVYNSAGYVMIKSPQHLFCDKANYVREYRLIVEKHIGRYLFPEEKCHHINGIKDDDRPKNLMAFISNSAHMRFHNNSNNVKPEEIIFDGRKFKRRDGLY